MDIHKRVREVGMCVYTCECVCVCVSVYVCVCVCARASYPCASLTY